MKVKRIIWISIICISFMQCENNDESNFSNKWRPIYQDDFLNFNSLRFINQDTGFVLADTSETHYSNNWKMLLSTNNGGDSWDQVPCSTYDTINQEPLYDLVKIFSISSKMLISTGYQVHISTDKGNVWKLIYTGISGPLINDLYIIDDNTWLIAKGNLMMKTFDSGNTWRTVYQTSSLGSFQKFSFPNKNIGYISFGRLDYDNAKTMGLIYKTLDAGETWQILNSEPWHSNSILLPYLKSLQFVTDEIGYMTAYDNNLYKSIDGGNNWKIVSNKDRISGTTYFFSEDEGFCFIGSTIYFSANGGKTWDLEYLDKADNSDILLFNILNTGAGFALTRNHKILKRVYH